MYVTKTWDEFDCESNRKRSELSALDLEKVLYLNFLFSI